MHPLSQIILMLSLLSTICFAQSTNELDSANDTPTGISILKAKSSNTGLNTLEHTLLTHFTALSFDETESFIINGSYTTQGVDLDLKIYAKRPGLLRHSLKNHGVNHTGGYNGHNYWTTAQTTPDDNSMATLNDLVLQFECNHAALLWGFEQDGLNGLKYVGEGSFKSTPCYIIENTKFPNLNITHYLDAKNGIELGRETTLNVSANTYKLLLVYDISKAASPNESKWPDGYKLYINDELYANAKFSSVRVNAGLTTWIFEAPKER